MRLLAMLLVIGTAACGENVTPTLAPTPNIAGAPSAPPVPLPPPAWTGPRLVQHPAVSVDRPTLLYFGVEAPAMFTHPRYREIVAPLEQDWLIVALDPPAHGDDRRAGEDRALAAWATRIRGGDPLVPPFTDLVSRALDYLIASGQTDPARVFVAGISRGGFLALHVATVEPRIRGVVAMMPVTDLRALKEFAALQTHPYTIGLALHARAQALARVPLYVRIAADDDRVGGATCAAFVALVTQAGGSVDFQTRPGREHGLPSNWGLHAAQWLRSQP